MEIKELLKHNIKLLDANLSEMRKIRREFGDWQRKFGWRWNQNHPVKRSNQKSNNCMFKY